LSNDDQITTVAEGADLAEIAVVLARGMHRVIVVDKAGKIVNFITQSALLELIVKHKQYLGNLLLSSIFDLKIGMKEVVTIGAGETAFEAFKLIADKVRHQTLFSADLHLTQLYRKLVLWLLLTAVARLSVTFPSRI